MARRFTHRPIRSSKRTSQWISLRFAPAVIGASTAILLGSLNAAALALRPFTIVRTRMDLRWASDQAAAAEDPFGSFGMMVVTDTAAALGVTAIPDPGSNEDSDWFLWQGLSVVFSLADATGIDANGGARYDIDSKAMRKVGADDDIVSVVSNLNSADGGVITINGRMLLKLH